MGAGFVSFSSCELKVCMFSYFVWPCFMERSEKDSKKFAQTFCDEYILLVTLKLRLSNKNVINKQYIRPSLVNKTLENWLRWAHSIKQVRPNNAWEDMSKRCDPELREPLINKKSKSKVIGETDSERDVGSSNFMVENWPKFSSVPYPTVLHKIDGLAYHKIGYFISHPKNISYCTLLLIPEKPSCIDLFLTNRPDKDISKDVILLRVACQNIIEWQLLSWKHV